MRASVSRTRSELKLKIVVGYKGQNESFLAMEAGLRIEGYPPLSLLAATRPEWITQKKVKYIVQYGPEKEPDAGDTPTVEQATKTEDKLLLKAAIAPPRSTGPI